MDLGMNSPQKSITTVETTVSSSTEPWAAMLSHPAADASRRRSNDMQRE